MEAAAPFESPEPEPKPVDLNAPPGERDDPFYSRGAESVINSELRVRDIVSRLRHPDAAHRPAIEVRLISPDSYPDAEEMFDVWNKVKDMEFFLADSERNPYILEQLITAPTTTAFLLGKPAAGIMWAHSIQRGYQAGVAMATWNREAWGRTKEVQIALRAVIRVHNLHRVFALVCMANKLSLRFMSRLGFTQEGTLKEGLCYNGLWHDVAVMGLLARDTASWDNL